MAKLSKNQTTGNLHPRETIFTGGVLASNGAEIITEADGAASFALDLRDTFSGTFEVSGSVDGTNWVLIPVRPINMASISYVTAITGTAQGTWVGKCAQYRFIRVRTTAWTSGSAIVTLAADTAPLDDSLNGMVTPLIATTTAAVGVASTLTLASPGAGLRHYLTYISINRSASAALTAGATPTIVTSTNLPGSLAFTFGANAALQGEDKIIREDFAYPLAASAQATATTIVAPATTGVIWRITVGYYVAP